MELVHRTTDGGARQGGADLWCTYAAVRALTWLGHRPADPDAAIRQMLACQNTDGAFAWQRGLPSDVWATYYCTQTLRDLGADPPMTTELADWLGSLQQGGFAMMPGQRPDAWATYYATRTYREILGTDVPDQGGLRTWLGRLQHRDGGLAWNPDADQPDVRACYYGAMAWRSAFGADPVPWSRDLVDWINARQTAEGGFVFADPRAAACMWATFRAVRALDALGAKPDRISDCLAWIADRELAEGFARWADRPAADVWACFSAVGAAQTLGASPGDPAAVLRFLRSCELPDGGFTYRAPEAAGDSLATSAALLTEAVGAHPDPAAVDRYAGWLLDAHLPYEGGVMYMPGRGAEVRCTLWAVSALREAGRDLPDVGRITAWCRAIQNADGGFGYWEGRGSDMVATASAVETLSVLGQPVDVLDVTAVRAFVESCRADNGYRHLPGGVVTCSATAQAVRVLALLDEPDLARGQARMLDGFASRLGGFSADTRGLPDLVSTYQAVLARQALGLEVDRASLRRLLDKTHRGDGYAWNPLSPRPTGVLALSLGTLLAADRPLPRLNL